MFDFLSTRLSDIFSAIRGKTTISAAVLDETLREVRIALLEADVSLEVITAFLDNIRIKITDTPVLPGLTAGQNVLKVVQTELTAWLGSQHDGIDFQTKPPVVILLVGLQGSGKTTHAAKLAAFIKKNHQKSVMLVSTDTQRPAAIDQLQSLAAQIEVPYATIHPTAKTALQLAHHALLQSQKEGMDVLIVDTAGRHQMDEPMMQELRALHKELNPHETLLVIDSMLGQESLHIAKAFEACVALTGLILTKLDGDARGGAALAARYVTQKPIKFMGMGEKIADFAVFHPERIASQILGMGDMMSLIEQAEQSIDKKTAKKVAKKIKSGVFDLDDFKTQLLEMNKMGGMAALMSKFPGMSGGAKSIDPKMLQRHLAVLNSMTMKERAFPDLIKGSRKQRIAKGSGTEIQHVNQLLKQFEQLQKVMKNLGKKNGMQGMLRKMRGLLPANFTLPF